MIPLATKVLDQEPLLYTFPEGLEDDNKQSDESDDSITEQEQENAED